MEGLYFCGPSLIHLNGGGSLQSSIATNVLPRVALSEYRLTFVGVSVGPFPEPGAAGSEGLLLVLFVAVAKLPAREPASVTTATLGF